METHGQSRFLGQRSGGRPGRGNSIRKWKIGKDKLYFVILIANSTRKKRIGIKGQKEHRQLDKFVKFTGLQNR